MRTITLAAIVLMGSALDASQGEVAVKPSSAVATPTPSNPTSIVPARSAKVEPIPATEVQGIVVTPSGKPAAKARVALLALPRPGDVSTAPILTTTDDFGTFRFDVKGIKTFSLHAHAPPLALVTLPRLTGGRRVTLKLEAGGGLKGVVLDATTLRPLANASIEASEWDVSPFADLDPAFGLVRGTSDAKGRFTLTGLAPSGRFVSRARLRGYATNTLTSVSPSGLVFRLEPGHNLAAAITDFSGRPVANAKVMLRPTLRRGSDTFFLQSNASGRFEFVGLRNVPYDLTITAEGFAPFLKDAIAKDTTSLMVTMEKSSRVTGRFVDENNQPLKGIARVRSWEGEATPSDVERLVTAEALADGRFMLSGLKTGTNVIDLRAHEFPRVERKAEVTKAGETVDVGDVRFERGLSIRGRVSEGEDLPLAGARIQATRTARTTSTDPFFAEAGKDGRFELKGLDAETYQLSITAEGFARQSKKASPSEESVEILMRRVVSLSGRLMDVDGQPVARARMGAQKGSDQSGSSSALTTGDGRFTLDLGETGEIQLSATAEGFKPLTQTVQVDAPLDLGDLVLSRGMRLRGSVVDAKGAPVAGARVANHTTRQSPTTFTETDEKGQFELTGATAGRVRLVATHWQYSPGQVFVEAKEGEEAEEARITLASGGRIEGVVRHRDQSPVRQALVHLFATSSNADLRSMTNLQMALTEADGSFVFEHIVPGPFNVILMTGPGAQGPGSYTNVDQASVSLVEGETTNVNLTLRATTVRGTVRRQAGSTGGLWVSMRSPFVKMSGGENRVASLVGDIPWHTAAADSEGRFALRIIGPVKARVGVSAADRQTLLMSKEVEVPDADEFQLSLDVVGARMTGRVVDVEGKGIGDVSATAVRARGRGEATVPGSRTARTGSSGQFAFELEPGEYQVSVTADGYAGSAPRKFTMTTSDLALDEIALSRGGSISGRATFGGQPVAQARVDAAVMGTANIQTRYTGPDGYFTVTGLPDEAIRLVVSDDVGHVGVHLAPSGSTDPIEVRLGPAARLIVTLLGPKDMLANANVSIANVDGYPSTGWSQADGNGRASLFAPPGLVTVRASSGGLEGETLVQTEAGATLEVSIELTLKKAHPSKD